MKKSLLAGIVGLLLAIGLSTSASAQGDGTVTVVHGVPGVTVDVYVNGDLTLEGFTPETVTDPLTLPAGDYNIDIRAAGDPADADPIISGSATLPAGANASIVAYLDASGAPTLGAFVNDLSAVQAGQGRLVARHTAAAPAVDVLANGEVAFSNVSNGDEGQADLPAGTISAAVVATGTTDPVLGPVDVPVVEGQVTIVYAVGSLEESTLTALTQTISGLEVSGSAESAPVPSGVPSGDSGLVAEDGNSFPALAVAMVAIAGLGIVFFGRRAIRSTD